MDSTSRDQGLGNLQEKLNRVIRKNIREFNYILFHRPSNMHTSRRDCSAVLRVLTLTGPILTDENRKQMECINEKSKQKEAKGVKYSVSIGSKLCIFFVDRTDPAKGEKWVMGWEFTECFPAHGGFRKRKVILTKRECGSRGSKAAEAVRC